MSKNSLTVSRRKNFPSLSEIQIRTAVVEYFKECKNNNTIPQLAGLLIVLGISRALWTEYSKKYPVIVNRANHYIEREWVEDLRHTGSSSGAMFYLKNMFADIYKDKSTNLVSTDGGNIQVNIINFNDKDRTSL